MSDALGRISARAREVLHAYEPGFAPEATDVRIAGKAPVESSADALSVVAPEGTYFVVNDGHGGSRYTRDGTFSFAESILRTRNGDAVFGFGGSDGKLRAIAQNAVDRALGASSGERIDADGSVSYLRATLDPRSGRRREERVVLGRIALARFPAGTLPLRMDATHVQAPRGVTPHLGRPGDGNFAGLAVHARDLGQLDLMAGLARLQEAYLSFEALRAAYTAHQSVSKTTMELLK